MTERTPKQLIVDTLVLIRGIATDPTWRAAGETATLAPSTMAQVESALEAAMEIDPLAVTNYNRTQEQLERFWLFCILVAGKDSDWAARKVGQMLRRKPVNVSPLKWLGDQLDAGTLHSMLVANKVGQYTRIERAIADSRNLNLRTATRDELYNVFGVGMKTASFFILHTRPDSLIAVIDTHILKWLRDMDLPNVPKTVPSDPRKYLEWERTILHLMDIHYTGISPAQADLLIWSVYSGRLEVEYKEPTLPGEPA